MMPAAMIFATQSAPASTVGNSEQDTSRGLGLLQNAHRDFRDHAKQSLRSRHQPHQIIELRIEMLAAEPQDLAAHQHDLEAKDVVGRETVFEAMHATEFSPTLPPIEQAICEEGSGA